MKKEGPVTGIPEAARRNTLALASLVGAAGASNGLGAIAGLRSVVGERKDLPSLVDRPPSCMSGTGRV